MDVRALLKGNGHGRDGDCLEAAAALARQIREVAIPEVDTMYDLYADVRAFPRPR